MPDADRNPDVAATIGRVIRSLRRQARWLPMVILVIPALFLLSSALSPPLGSPALSAVVVGAAAFATVLAAVFVVFSRRQITGWIDFLQAVQFRVARAAYRRGRWWLVFDNDIVFSLIMTNPVGSLFGVCLFFDPGGRHLVPDEAELGKWTRVPLPWKATNLAVVAPLRQVDRPPHAWTSRLRELGANLGVRAIRLDASHRTLARSYGPATPGIAVVCSFNTFRSTLKGESFVSLLDSLASLLEDGWRSFATNAGIRH